MCRAHRHNGHIQSDENVLRYIQAIRAIGQPKCVFRVWRNLVRGAAGSAVTAGASAKAPQSANGISILCCQFHKTRCLPPSAATVDNVPLRGAVGSKIAHPARDRRFDGGFSFLATIAVELEH